MEKIPSSRLEQKEALTEQLKNTFDVICFYRAQLDATRSTDTVEAFQTRMDTVIAHVEQTFSPAALEGARAIKALKSKLDTVNKKIERAKGVQKKDQALFEEYDHIYEQIGDLENNVGVNSANRLIEQCQHIVERFRATRELEDLYHKNPKAFLEKLTSTFAMFAKHEIHSRAMVFERDIASVQFTTVSVEIYVYQPKLFQGTYAIMSHSTPFIFISSHSPNESATHEEIHALSLPSIMKPEGSLANTLRSFPNNRALLERYLSPTKVLDGWHHEIIAALPYAVDRRFQNEDLVDHVLQTAGNALTDEIERSKDELEYITDPEIKSFAENKIASLEHLYHKMIRELQQAFNLASQSPEPERARWLVECGCATLKPSQYRYLPMLLQHAAITKTS